MKELIDVMILDEDKKLAMEQMLVDTEDKNWKQIEGEYPGVQQSKDKKLVRIESEGKYTYWEKMCHNDLDIDLGCALATADAEILKETGKTTEQIIKKNIK